MMSKSYNRVTSLLDINTDLESAEIGCKLEESIKLVEDSIELQENKKELLSNSLDSMKEEIRPVSSTVEKRISDMILQVTYDYYIYMPQNSFTCLLQGNQYVRKIEYERKDVINITKKVEDLKEFLREKKNKLNMIATEYVSAR